MENTKSPVQENWIKDLVRQEQNQGGRESFLDQNTPSYDELAAESIEFLKDLRTAFTNCSVTFNHLKGFLGSLRIYGIAGTLADFMLFRKGHRLVFSMQEPGLISVQMKLNQQILNPTEGQKPDHSTSADYIKAEWGAFNELKWTYNNQPINIDYLLRYYMTLFVKNSAQ